MRMIRSRLLRYLCFAGTIATVLLPLLIGMVLGDDWPRLIVTPAGYWYLDAEDNGQPVLVPVESVIRFGAGDTPGPVPPVIPKDATAIDGDVVELVRTATVRIGHFDDAQRLALVYDAMADQLSAGALTTNTVFDAIVSGTEVTLRASGGGENWKPWRQEVGRLTTTLTMAGKLRDASQIRVYLKSVVRGLQVAVPNTFARLSLSDGVAVISACSAIVEAISHPTPPKP